jgi:hypothetical protein
LYNNIGISINKNLVQLVIRKIVIYVYNNVRYVAKCYSYTYVHRTEKGIKNLFIIIIIRGPIWCPVSGLRLFECMDDDLLNFIGKKRASEYVDSGR